VVVFEALDTGASGRLAKRGGSLAVSVGAATEQLAGACVAILGIIATRCALTKATVRSTFLVCAIRDTFALALAADSIAGLAGVAAVILAAGTTSVITATFTLAIGQASNTFS